MRNIFDQYSQPENKLTHALVSSLAADPQLLRKFVRWATEEERSALPGGRLQIVEQQLPGQEGEDEQGDEKDASGRGLPDAWIHDGKEWALIIESKIESPLTAGQLRRHRGTAERRGFKGPILAIVTNLPKRRMPENVRVFLWTEVYSWMKAQSASEWARRLTEYMEVLERRLVADDYLKEGTITVFAGISFGKDNPYSYKEAKRLLRLAMEELRKRKGLQHKLGIDTKAKGRVAITGRDEGSVWDYLSLVKARSGETFTKFPHFILGIVRGQLEAMVTIPNGIRSEYLQHILAGGKESFCTLFETILKNLKEAIGEVEGCSPWMEILQRHYVSRRAKPIADARLEFDLRTAFDASEGWGKNVKKQLQWMETVYDVLASRRSNVQFAVGAVFPYDRCPVVSTPKILNCAAEVWLACAPLIVQALG